MATKSFTITKTILHDHKLHRPGMTLQLEEKQAKPLIDLGVITPGEDALGAPTAASLGKLTKDGLVGLAGQYGIEISADATKGAIIEQLLASGKLTA